MSHTLTILHEFDVGDRLPTRLIHKLAEFLGEDSKFWEGTASAGHEINIPLQKAGYSLVVCSGDVDGSCYIGIRHPARE